MFSIQNNGFELHDETSVKKTQRNPNNHLSKTLECAQIHLLSFNSIYLNHFLKLHIQMQLDDTILVPKKSISMHNLI